MNGRSVDFRLGDGEARHAMHPRTFFIPSRERREALQPDDCVRLLFDIVDPEPGTASAERMWVVVTEADDQGYTGWLTNQPHLITTITAGDTVRFRPEHVIAIEAKDPWTLMDKKIFVPRRSHEQDIRPCWVYREHPDDDNDSGWRALIGDETDEELGDPSAILLQQVGFLLDRWPELEPVFRTDPANGWWRWDSTAHAYVSISDSPD